MSAITSRSVPPSAVSFVSPPAASRSAPGSRTVTAMNSLPKWGAEISVSPISYQHDDTARFFPRDRDRRGHGRCTSSFGADALLTRETLCHRERLLRSHHHMRIRDAFVPDRRTKRSWHVLPAFDAVHRVVRLHRHDPDALRTSPSQNADDVPGLSDAGHKVGHTSAGLLPDLG